MDNDDFESMKVMQLIEICKQYSISYQKDIIERIRNALINQEDDVRGDNGELEDDDEEQDMAWLYSVNHM